jgi:hypothetical protein
MGRCRGGRLRYFGLKVDDRRCGGERHRNFGLKVDDRRCGD